MATGKEFGTLAFVERMTGAKGEDALAALVGQVHQIGNPNVEAGESWDDYPPERIIKAYASDEPYRFMGEKQPYILVDTVEA